jgi:hypothetical protein
MGASSSHLSGTAIQGAVSRVSSRVRSPLWAHLRFCVRVSRPALGASLVGGASTHFGEGSMRLFLPTFIVVTLLIILFTCIFGA